MHGNGLLLRDVGRLSPKVRKLLEQVGNEKVNSVTLYLLVLLLNS